MSEEPAEYNIAYKDNVDKLGSKSKTVAAILKKQWDDLVNERNLFRSLLNFAVMNERNFTEYDPDGVKKQWVDKARAAIEKVTPKPKPNP